MISREAMRSGAYSTGAAFFVAGLALARPASAADEDVIRAVLARSLPLLQTSAQVWIDKRSCVSCHHQALGVLAVGAARARGIRADEALFEGQLRRMFSAEPALMLVGEGAINGQIGRAYMLLGMGGAGVPRSPETDVMAYFVAGKQAPDGRFPSMSHRPPLEDSDVTATALDVRALAAYGPPARSTEWRERIANANAWLAAAPARTNEDRTFRLLGLSWGEASAASISAAAQSLLAAQRFDGGWAQLPTRASDAYATGQALVALNQTGRLASSDPAYRRGVEYLLRTGLPDGTWRVDTRRRAEGLPYFETGFPHGEDQFISYAATAWATMALAIGLPGPPLDVFGIQPRAGPARRVEPQKTLELTPLHEALLFGTLDDVRARLDAGDDPNLGLPGNGITPLMCAVSDIARVRLLLERGARPDARSKGEHTALLLAAGYSGDARIVALLLELGADPRAASAEGLSPIQAAAESADPAKVELLLAAGAGLEDGSPDRTPLLLASYQRDDGMVRRLARRGADTVEGSVTMAAIDGSDRMVRTLLEVGAPAVELGDDGMTPLHWAAASDPGHAEIVDALISAGADPNARTLDGRSPLELAEGFGYWHIADRLRAAGARCD
jgi:ankyrin repeat protein